jgi:hypothetical protein
MRKSTAAYQTAQVTGVYLTLPDSTFLPVIRIIVAMFQSPYLCHLYRVIQHRMLILVRINKHPFLFPCNDSEKDGSSTSNLTSNNIVFETFKCMYLSWSKCAIVKNTAHIQSFSVLGGTNW